MTCTSKLNIHDNVHNSVILLPQSTEQLSRIGADLNTVNRDLSMQVGDLRRKLRCCNSNDDDDDYGCHDNSSLDLWGSNNARTVDACLAAADQVCCA